ASDLSTLELAESVRTLDRGEFPCPTSIASILLRHAAASRDHSGRSASPLTTRERDIAALIERGLTNKETATALSIEVATVKNHVHHVLEKVGVARRAAIAAKLRHQPSEQQDLDRRV